MTVQVDELVYEGLQDVQEADVNHYHHGEARKWLFLNDYFQAAHWVRDHPKEYGNGLCYGFASENVTESEL